VGNEKRDIVKAPRNTEQGKYMRAQNEGQRVKNKEMFKLTLGNKRGDNDDSDWEDYEEDFPAVKLEELVKNLDEMKLDDSDEEKEE